MARGLLEVESILLGQMHTRLLKKQSSKGLLCKAAALGNISKLQEMLQDGVSLNACDYDGRTAAHLAASNGYFRALKWLVGHGATINVMDRFGNTPLDDAIRERHSEIEQYLRERISPQKTQ